MSAPTLAAVRDAGVNDPESLAGILSDADALALMDEAERAPEPGADGLGLNALNKPKETIYRDEDATMVAVALKSSGYVRVYDRTTGELSVVSRNNLPQVLKKRNEDGQQVFTTKKPSVTPTRGAIKCPLHAERRTDAMTAMGLPVCRKANLTSEFQARLHMQHRHESAWKAIEEQKKLDREDEERAGRQALMQLVQQSQKGKG